MSSVRHESAEGGTSRPGARRGGTPPSCEPKTDQPMFRRTDGPELVTEDVLVVYWNPFNELDVESKE